MNRAVMWLWSLALAGAFFALTGMQAHAAKLPQFQQMGVLNSTGKSVTLGAEGAWGSAVPIAPTIGGGWQQAGNYGVNMMTPTGGPTMNLGGSGNVFFSGTKYPFQAGYVQPVSVLMTAASLLASNPLVGIALTIGGPYMLDWLAKSGGRVDPANPNALQRSDPDTCTSAPCFEYSVIGSPPGVWFPSQSAACSAAFAYANSNAPGGGYSSARNFQFVGPGCKWDWYDASGAFNVSSSPTPSSRPVDPKPSNWLPSSMDDIAPYMNKTAPDPRVVQELLNKGADIPLGTPTITGPSSVDGPSTTSQNADGSKTVTTTTYNFSTAGNTITNTSVVENSTTYNTDNSVRSVSSTTKAPTDGKPDDGSVPADSALPDQPKLYTPKYPDGLVGVWSDQSQNLKSTALVGLASSLMPSIPDGGSCPAWNMNLNLARWANFGTVNVAPPCYVWDWCRLIILVGALFLCRALIFGG